MLHYSYLSAMPGVPLLRPSELVVYLVCDTVAHNCSSQLVYLISGRRLLGVHCSAVDYQVSLLCTVINYISSAVPFGFYLSTHSNE